jgi:hypothetical protein
VGYRTRQRESNEIPLKIVQRRGSWLPLLQVAGLLGWWEISIFGFLGKVPYTPPLRWESLYPLALTCVPSASLSQSTHSPVWVGDLISMASMLSTDHPQLSPRFHHGIRLSVLATSNLLAARLYRSLQSVRDGPAGQLLPSSRTADLSKDREIFNSGDDSDLPSVKQILASSKRPK